MSGDRNDKLGKHLGEVAFIDNNNTSTTALGGNATFVGGWTHALHYNTVKIAMKSDVGGTLTIQQATRNTGLSGTIMMNTAIMTYAGSDNPQLASVQLFVPWYRLIYVNDATTQVYMTLSSIVKVFA